MKAKDSIWIFFYITKSKASIPTDDLIPLVRPCRNHHSMAYQVPIAINTDFYKCSFSPQTIRDWNALPDSLISSMKVPRMVLWWELGTSLSDPGEWLSFWSVTSKQFWFWRSWRLNQKDCKMKMVQNVFFCQCWRWDTKSTPPKMLWLVFLTKYVF